MTFTVEKIGGTSMTAFDAVLDNIILRPKNPYNRIFVVSAYSGMTDALLECKKTGKPGVYQLIAMRDDSWEEALSYIESRMLLINEHIFADPMNRARADKFIRSRISEAKNCITNILETCQYGQFSLRHYLPQIREFLSSIGESHSAYNTALKLKNIGIVHDKFQSEREIVNNNEVQKTVDKLIKKKFVYKGKIKAPEGEDKKNWVEREQLLFKSTDFGDDKDRALQKSDNSWTYFAGDVAYHENKLNRKYDTYINILGADHAGYIKRITASVEALSGEKNKLVCKVSQLVKLIKDGKPFKMSKRKGDYITVEDLIEQVGKDATKFIMLNRSSDAEIDFDFDKVKEKSKDNPLYYVQYCYARICSVFRHIGKEIDKDIKVDEYNFNFSPEDIDIYKKISEWPKCIEISSKKLEPHRVPTYLYELSSLFHSYWNMGKDDKSKRFISEDKKISDEKLVLLKSVSNVIKCGMNLVGASTPEKM